MSLSWARVLIDMGGKGEEADAVWWRGHGVSNEDVDSIRQSISRGIVAEAIATGRTVDTPSALTDARFRDLGSVRRFRIQAVMCVPVSHPPIGVVYLQGRGQPGPFTSDDRANAELFARQLAPLADRLLARVRQAADADATREIRRRFSCPAIIGRSRAMAEVLEQASLVAPLDVDVLITGPSGTGKTLLARGPSGSCRSARPPFGGRMRGVARRARPVDRAGPLEPLEQALVDALPDPRLLPIT